MARWLDADFAEALSRSLATQVEFESLDGHLPALNDGSNTETFVHHAGDVFHGHALVRDVNGQPAFLITTTQERTIAALRGHVLLVGVLAITATTVLVGAGVFFGTDRFLLRPMLRLREELRTVDPRAGRGRVTVEGDDELADIARSVNAMLSRIMESTAEQGRLALAVSEQEEVARAALLAMSEGFVAFNADGRCDICNPAAARLLGIEPHEATGRTLGQLLPGASAGLPASPGPQLIEVERRTLAITQTTNTQRTHRADEPSARRGQRRVVVLRDVTDVLDVERLKQDIISTVSHELRTPHTSIRATVDLLNGGDGGNISPVQARMIQLLSRNTDRLLLIVNDLLTLTALEAGRVTLDHDEVDLAMLAAHVIEDMEPMAAAASVSLAIDGETNVVVACDGARMRQVIENVVSNAIKFSGTGHAVTVSVTMDGEWARVSVRDEGIGIPPGDQDRVFEKFYRAANGPRRPGKGLGLAIARVIVELHGGDIHVKSDGRSGTVAVVRVPLQAPAAVTAESGR